MIAAGRRDGTVDVINTETGNVISQLAGHENVIKELAFSNDDALVVTTSLDLTIRAAEVKSRKSILVLSSSSHFRPRLAVNPKSSEWLIAYSPSANEIVGISDPAKPGRKLFSITEKDEAVFSFAVSPNGKYIACGMSDAVWILDAKSGELLGKRKGREPEPVTHLCFTADSKAVIFEQSGTIDVWSVAKDARIYSLGNPFQGDAGAIFAFRTSQDNAVIAVHPTKAYLV